MNSEPETLVDALLKPGAAGTEQEWRQVKEHLSASFAAYLGQEVEPVWEPLYEDISPTWGFSFGIRSRQGLGGPLGLEWYAVISHNSHGHTRGNRTPLRLRSSRGERRGPCVPVLRVPA